MKIIKLNNYCFPGNVLFLFYLGWQFAEMSWSKNAIDEMCVNLALFAALILITIARTSFIQLRSPFPVNNNGNLMYFWVQVIILSSAKTGSILMSCYFFCIISMIFSRVSLSPWNREKKGDLKQSKDVNSSGRRRNRQNDFGGRNQCWCRQNEKKKNY